MSPLPRHRPRQLSLGPLEAEILAIIWARGRVTAKEIHDHILADPDRDLALASVTTVLQRLAKKGWLNREVSRPMYKVRGALRIVNPLRSLRTGRFKRSCLCSQTPD